MSVRSWSFKLADTKCSYPLKVLWSALIVVQIKVGYRFENIIKTID